MAKDKAAKKEKAPKVDDSGVTKTKKVKKEKKEKKRAPTPPSDASDNDVKVDAPIEPESSEDVPMQDAEVEVEAEAEPSVEKKTKKGKKEKKDKGEGKSKKTKKAKAEADDEADNPAEPAENGNGMLFALDVNPTPIDLDAVPARADQPRTKKDQEGDEPKKNRPPSGLNRDERRRIKLIERQRLLIKKKMGIPADSQEQADEVQAAVDEWTTQFDTKTAWRNEKKMARKAKEAARLRNKRGKILTGRKLKEREKQIRKIDKKAEKKASKRSGISANNA